MIISAIPTTSCEHILVANIIDFSTIEFQQIRIQFAKSGSFEFVSQNMHLSSHVEYVAVKTCANVDTKVCTFSKRKIAALIRPRTRPEQHLGRFAAPPIHNQFEFGDLRKSQPNLLRLGERARSRPRGNERARAPTHRIRRRMNIELNFPPNCERLVLGCIDADFCK